MNETKKGLNLQAKEISQFLFVVLVLKFFDFFLNLRVQISLNLIISLSNALRFEKKSEMKSDLSHYSSYHD